MAASLEITSRVLVPADPQRVWQVAMDWPGSASGCGGRRSDHRGKKAARRLRDTYPNCVMIHTPGHASWLNQVEIFFSIMQKKVISPNDFPGTVPLAATLQRFIARYNTTAAPFNWKYTAADLGRHLARIDSIRLASITGQAAAPATLKAA
jgi:hypothetical protein